MGGKYKIFVENIFELYFNDSIVDFEHFYSLKVDLTQGNKINFKREAIKAFTKLSLVLFHLLSLTKIQFRSRHHQNNLKRYKTTKKL